MRYLRLQKIAFTVIFLFLFVFHSGHLNSEYIIKWEKWEMNTHTGQVWDMVVGAGRNDSVTYIYTIEYNLSGYCEINEYDLVSGYKSRLGTFYDWWPVDIAIGDGSGLGKNLIYYKNTPGEIYSYEYQNNTWVNKYITYYKDSVELENGLSVGSLGGAYHIFTFDSDNDLFNIYWTVLLGWTSEEIPYNGFWGNIIPGALTLGNGDSSVSGNEVYAAASASSPTKQLYEIYYSWPNWVYEVIDSSISTDIIVAGNIDSWSGREIYVNNNTYDEITEYRKPAANG